MRGQASRRSGATTGDALVVASLLFLGFAVVYPRLASARFQQSVDAALADIELLRSAATAYHAQSGVWPDEAPPGTVPAELASSVPADFSLAREGYLVDWSVWELVQDAPADSVEDVLRNVNPSAGLAPPDLEVAEEPQGPVLEPLAGITLQTEETAILAALLDYFGPTRSFVHGSRWTLVLREGN